MKKYLYFYSVIFAVFGIFYVISSSYSSLPDIESLGYYDPGSPTVFYSQDNEKIAELFTEKRNLLPLKDISPLLQKAFIDSEDAHFYSHNGFEWTGFLRALYHYVTFSKQKQGGSTITQQLAKNFLLTKERTITRKVKNIILALRIEKRYSKQKILELYLNNIYLGNGSYGVEAAAQNYFHKSNKELNLAQATILAGLAPAPSLYDPTEHFELAKSRQIYVLNQMFKNGDLSQHQYMNVAKEKLTFFKAELLNNKVAPYFVAEVTKQIQEQYQLKNLTDAGLIVYTTLNTKIQAATVSAIQKFTHEHEEMKTFKGPFYRFGNDYKDDLEQMINDPFPKGDERKAIVVNVNRNLNVAAIVTQEGLGIISAGDVPWALSSIRHRDMALRSIDNILKVGDEIHVKKIRNDIPARVLSSGKFLVRLKSFSSYYEDYSGSLASYTLTDTEQIQSAAMVMNSQTGEVLAMVGGNKFTESQFNRATQAERQVGSSIKPLYYSFAIDNGFSPLSLIDTPDININGWAPKNYKNELSGRVSMLDALTKSLNVPSVFLYETLGTSKVTHQLNRYGFDWPMSDLTMALGAGTTTLLKMVQAYSVFPNKGKITLAYYVNKIIDKKGRVIYSHSNKNPNEEENDQQSKFIASPVDLSTTEDASYLPGKDTGVRTNETDVSQPPGQMISPQAAYVTLTMLKNVINKGTGIAASGISPYFGGKTGTTSENTDAWFIGVASNLVAGAWVGYDDNSKTLGAQGTGGTMPVYIWRSIMQKAIQVYPQNPWEIPPGLSMVNEVPVISGTAPGESYARNAFQDEATSASAPIPPSFSKKKVLPQGIPNPGGG